MYYVYFLQSELNGRYYVGITNNVERRLKEHNSGIVRSTAPYKPWKLKRLENYADINQAAQRERFVKAKHSRKIVELIIADNNGPVAQLDSVSASEAEGCEFEPRQAHYCRKKKGRFASSPAPIPPKADIGEPRRAHSLMPNY
jgi:putative endonuclease